MWKETVVAWFGELSSWMEENDEECGSCYSVSYFELCTPGIRDDESKYHLWVMTVHSYVLILYICNVGFNGLV